MSIFYRKITMLLLIFLMLMYSITQAMDREIKLPKPLKDLCFEYVRKQVTNTYPLICHDITGRYAHLVTEHTPIETCINLIAGICKRRYRKKPLCDISVDKISYHVTLPEDLLEHMQSTLAAYLYYKNPTFALLMKKITNHCIAQAISTQSSYPERTYTVLKEVLVPKGLRELVAYITHCHLAQQTTLLPLEHQHIRNIMNHTLHNIIPLQNNSLLVSHHLGLTHTSRDPMIKDSPLTIPPAFVRLLSCAEGDGSYACYKTLHPKGLGILNTKQPDKTQVISFENNIQTAALSTDGQLLALKLVDVIPIKMLNTKNGSVYSELETVVIDPMNPIHLEHLKFSPQNKYLAGTHTTGEVYIWKNHPWQFYRLTYKGFSRIGLCHFSPDQSIIAIKEANLDDLFCIDIETEKVKKICHHPDTISVAISNHTNIIATGSRNGSIFLWHFDQEKPIHILRNHRQPINALTALNTNGISTLRFSSCGKELIVGSEQGDLFIWKDPHTIEHYIFFSALERSIKEKKESNVKTLLSHSLFTSTDNAIKVQTQALIMRNKLKL